MNGGPAFPRHFVEPEYARMSKREWYAGQALAGVMASGGHSTYEKDAEAAVKAADATLAELAKEKV